MQIDTVKISPVNNTTHYKIFAFGGVVLTASNDLLFGKAFRNFDNHNYYDALQDLDILCGQRTKDYLAALVMRACCNIQLQNHTAACDDLTILKISEDIGFHAQDVYYRYCSDPMNVYHKKSNRPGITGFRIR